MTRTEHWRGSLTIGDGWAILEGLAGANAPHAHLAHQLTSCADEALEIVCLRRTHSLPKGQYAAIPSGLEHALGPIGVSVRSIYLDRARFDLPGHPQRQGLAVVDPSLTAALNMLDAPGALAALLRHQSTPDRPIRPNDPLIKLLDIAPKTATPGSIANSLGISASRLRQISHSRFGAPISHVLQWRQLQHAARALSESASLAEAAEAGGFADQSHFSRRMRRWFGVSPGLGFSGLTVRVAETAQNC